MEDSIVTNLASSTTRGIEGDCLSIAAASSAPLNPSASDQELLTEYSDRHSDAAFAEVVRRHWGLVYSAALRQTGSPVLAEEVTQTVFIVLARKAGALTREMTLAGWLFRASRYAALDARKMEERRKKREQAAVMNEMTDSSEDSAAAWEQLVPLIDEAISRLGASDRNAILLRFFEKKSFHEIGAALGTNHNVARSRVVRAVDRLRKLFRKRGVILSEGLAHSALRNAPLTAAPSPSQSSATVALAINARLSPAPTQVQTLLRRLFWRQAARGGTHLILASVLALTLSVLAVRLRDASLQSAAGAEIRRVVGRIDAAYSFDNSQEFLACIYFRDGDDQFGPVLVNYVHAAASFRDAAKYLLNRADSSFQAFTMTLEPLLSIQPQTRSALPSDSLATAPWIPGYSLSMIKDGAVWKWDYFGSATREVRDRNIEMVRTKTLRLQALARQIRSGDFTNSDQTLKALAAAVR